MNRYWILCMSILYMYISSFLSWDEIKVLCVCMLSRVWLFDSPGKNTGVGCHFFLSRGSSQPRDRTCSSCSSCIGRCILYRSATGSPKSQLFNLDEFFKESAHVCSVVSESLQPHGLYSTRLLYPWNFPSKNTGMGCHFLLRGIFQPRDWTCVSWQVDSLPLHHLGSIYIYIYIYISYIWYIYTHYTHTADIYIYIFTNSHLSCMKDSIL